MDRLRSTFRRVDAGLAAVHDHQRGWPPLARAAWWVLAFPLAVAAAAGAAAGRGRKALYLALAGFSGLVFLSAAESPEEGGTGVAADGTTTTTAEATTTTSAPTTTSTTVATTTTTVAPTTTAPPTTVPLPKPTTTTARRPASVATTAAPRQAPVATTTSRPPSAAAPAQAGHCTASVDNAQPTTNQTVTVLVESNVSSTPFTATAHYKSLDTRQQGTTGGSGAGAVSFMTSHATSGYTVRIDVDISGKATCATSFTPR